MTEDLGLDHFEGRSRAGLHHHVLLTMSAYGVRQHDRLTHRAALPALTCPRCGTRPAAA